jgi:hypothetical protein
MSEGDKPAFLRRAITEDVSGTNITGVNILPYQQTFKVAQIIHPSPEMLSSIQQSVEILFNQFIQNNLQLIEERVEEKITKRYGERIASIEKLLTNLSSNSPPDQGNIGKIKPGSELIGDKVISEKEVKDYILKNIEIGQIFYPSDIANELGINLLTVIEAINELKEEGRLEEKKK